MNKRPLSQEERCHIEVGLARGESLRAIARRLGRSPSVVCREVQRNSCPRGYLARAAQAKARLRLRQRNSLNCRKVDPAGRSLVNSLIELDWSPEQALGRLKKETVGLRLPCHETVYRWVLSDKKEGGWLHEHLRCRRRRKKRYGAISRRGHMHKAPKKSIDERPPAVLTRERLGDWEGDSIVGERHKSGLVTIVERKSGVVLCAKPGGPGPRDYSEALASLLSGLPPESLKTLTLDNGREFQDFESVEKRTGVPIYFAHPYSAHERGCNENANGLLRQYFPKSCPFDIVSAESLQQAVDRLNHRPRKRLGFKTPFEVFLEEASKISTPCCFWN